MANYTDVREGFKAGMRRLASSVSVVSLKTDDGDRYAMTATSVSSLSDDPISLLVCINKQAGSYPFLKKGVHFCVNVLSGEQEDVSNSCAGAAEGEERFKIGDWKDNPTDGLPYIGEAQVNFFCENDGVFEYGTHIIVVGKIIEVNAADGEVNPLLYADGAYRTLK